MAIWPYYVIASVILFNDIVLNLAIVLIYHLFPRNYISNILNFIHLLLRIGFSSLHCWNATRYDIIEKCTSLLSHCSFNIY